MKRFILAWLLSIIFVLNLKAITFDADAFTFKTMSTSEVAITASATSEYSGVVTVPSTVNYEGRTYRVTEIDRLAFRNCTKLTAISLPASVTQIGQMAFDGCISLKNVIMPGVKSIRDMAFQNTAITEITLPECLTSMFNAVFCGCKNLKKIQIPASLTNLGTNSPFIGCTSLAEIVVSNENPKYSSINGSLYSKDGKTLIAYPCGLSTVTIAEGTERIGRQSFKGNPHIASVTFPASVSIIEQYAFEECSSLIEFKVAPDNPTFEAEDGLLYYGNVLKLCPSARVSAIVKEGTKEIADQAFYECRRLTSVSLPTSMYEIGGQAFGYCTSLETIELPQMVSIIKIHAFGECTGLKSIVIPDNVTALPDDLFAGCKSLKTVTIGANVSNIGKAIFSNCDNIRILNVKASVPPEVKTDRGFVPESIYGVAQLNVPVGYMYEYKATMPWSNFVSISEVDFAGNSDIYVDPDDSHYPKYDLNGRILSNPYPGQIFIQNGVKRVWK